MRIGTALAVPAVAASALLGLAGTAAADGDAGNGNGDGNTATQTVTGNSIAGVDFPGHAFNVGNTGLEQSPVTITFARIG
ncbi:hypothetical protein ACFRDV_17345 [Streptomyces fagopyri]|uniref:hypothetical protein n=1 Tax=Streptomyces fagopyri TaxID=2662397 RepID=UPI0036A31D6B